MAQDRLIFFAGGGTGGHVYPGLAVAQAMRSAMPQTKAVFLCTRRPIDKTIIEPTGFEFIEQPIVQPVRTVSGLLRFWRSWRETREMISRLIKERPPAAVIGLGGYAAGAAVKGAASVGVPTALINPDVIPGKANQYLMRSVAIACCQFEQTRRYVAAAQRNKLRITGCPIRGALAHAPPRQEAVARLGLNPMLQTLVVTGASLGAQTVNEAVLEVAKKLKPQGWQVLHLSGGDHSEAVRAGYRDLEITANVIGFTPAMEDVWAVADLAISRSGASSCAELTACGIPSILFPYPFHKDMHQKLNAQVLADAGAAVVMDDQRDAAKNAQQLQPVLEALLFDAPRRQAMSTAAKALGKPDAANAVLNVISELLGQS